MIPQCYRKGCGNDSAGECVQCKKDVCDEHSEEHEGTIDGKMHRWCEKCWREYQDWLDQIA